MTHDLDTDDFDEPETLIWDRRDARPRAAGLTFALQLQDWFDRCRQALRPMVVKQRGRLAELVLRVSVARAFARVWWARQHVRDRVEAYVWRLRMTAQPLFTWLRAPRTRSGLLLAFAFGSGFLLALIVTPSGRTPISQVALAHAGPTTPFVPRHLTTSTATLTRTPCVEAFATNDRPDRK